MQQQMSNIDDWHRPLQDIQGIQESPQMHHKNNLAPVLQGAGKFYPFLAQPPEGCGSGPLRNGQSNTVIPGLSKS